MTKLFIAFIFFCFPSLALCMDAVKHDLIISQIFPNHIQNNPSACSHDTICALALVSKKWNQFIKNTSAERRRYFTSKQDYKDLRIANCRIYQQQVWHKNNSAYAYWVQMENRKTRFCLTYLDGNDTINTSEFKDTLAIPILQDYRPFFNAQGNVCFHAWYEEDIACSRLVELLLSTKNLLKVRNCYLNLGNNQTEQQGKYFIWVKSTTSVNHNKTSPTTIQHYPTLLKAFINSKHVEETDHEKIYHIDGVELEEDYLLNGNFPSNWWRHTVSENCIAKKNHTQM